jgi:hypothetical protein
VSLPWPFRRDGGLGTLWTAHGLRLAVAVRDALRIVGLKLLSTLGDYRLASGGEGSGKVGVVGTQLLPSPPRREKREKKARVAPPCNDALAAAWCRQPRERSQDLPRALVAEGRRATK